MEYVSGNRAIDSFMECWKNGRISVFYGSGGTGKTTMCLIASVEIARNNKKVLFIDTENNFSIERVRQLSGSYFHKILSNIIVVKIRNFKAQHDKIKELPRILSESYFSLIVVDSIGHFYRSLVRKKPLLANQMLNVQIRVLKTVSEHCNVIVTNQVYFDIKNNELRMLGNRNFESFFKCVIRLEHNHIRVMRMIKPQVQSLIFQIVGNGLEFKQ